jgi:hypothetical protein
MKYIRSHADVAKALARIDFTFRCAETIVR